jgi:hypothetical protein
MELDDETGQDISYWLNKLLSMHSATEDQCATQNINKRNFSIRSEIMFYSFYRSSSTFVEVPVVSLSLCTARIFDPCTSIYS